MGHTLIVFAQDQVDGKTDGVSGTPSIFVNGVLTFPGNVPFEDMKSGLDNVFSQSVTHSKSLKKEKKPSNGRFFFIIPHFLIFNLFC